ncbi:EamA family transporter [Pusillimonas sp. DMV24BSW_D]|uniref:EamA family transporter n=1 Tax=Neopusillimonas aestuarii TaxID=2716226 RepID=UPI00140C687C|nr:EamA family transporter [Pusillimonas sp. DMV24BSW_D]QIM48852.1 EamA family transporter [Pusillimonas sp. DMV24BSW_D]
MYVLLLSIGCSVAVSVLLKLARSRRFDLGQAIAVNYVAATMLTLGLLQPQPQNLLNNPDAWGLLGALGLLLPTVFLVMAMAVRHAGIVLSDAAQRLSLLVPLLAAFLIFKEVLTTQKLLGMVLAFVALVCLLIKKKSLNPNQPRAILIPLALVGVWLGYGIIDILFKQLARTGNQFSTSLLGAFVLAGSFMLVVLLFKKTLWTAKNVIAGSLLGVLNFGNIYFYIRAHQLFPENPSLVFASMNIGVICAGTLIGAVIFRERLGKVNVIGIALAIAAMLLLFNAI